MRRFAPNVGKRMEYTLRTLARMLFCGIPLTCAREFLSCSPFFIIGSGRSGNTLLRAMLVQNRAISIPPESYVLPAVVRKFYRYNYMPWPELVRLVVASFESHHLFYTWGLDLLEFYPRALKLKREEQCLARLIDLFYCYYAEKKYPGATRWGDKTPLNTLNLEKLDWVFPDARYVHVLRDGRDVALSYLEARIYSSLEDAAKRWTRSVDRARAFGRKIGRERFREITYENLVRDPESSLKGVCEFLDLEYVPEMLNFWEDSERLGDSTLSHHTNLKRPVMTESIGRWRQGFDSGQQGEVKKLLGPKLREMGYTDL